MTHLIRIARFAPVLLLSAAAAFAEPRLHAVDLSGAVDASAIPMAINEHGVIAFLSFAGGQFSSFLFDLNQGTVIRVFPAGDRVQALSNGGLTAGSSQFGTWFDRDGVREALPLAQALGVNDAGVVAGFAGGFFPLGGIFSTADRSLTPVGLGGRQSVALAINSDGVVAGAGNPPDSTAIHAFRWFQGEAQDLGTLGGDGNSFGRAVDQSGRIAGTAATSATESHAFLFEDGGMTDLGTLPGCSRSEALALNDDGVAVGQVDLCASGGARAVLFQDGTVFDLNQIAPAADGSTYTEARGINQRGVIVGIATAPGGSLRPFVLVPEEE